MLTPSLMLSHDSEAPLAALNLQSPVKQVKGEQQCQLCVCDTGHVCVQIQFTGGRG